MGAATATCPSAAVSGVGAHRARDASISGLIDPSPLRASDKRWTRQPFIPYIGRMHRLICRRFVAPAVAYAVALDLVLPLSDTHASSIFIG